MKSKFRPSKHSFTLILSSPAHFVGEYECDDFLLTHAWPTFGTGGGDWQENSPYARHFFALTFNERELSEEEEKARNPPYYWGVGDYFGAFMSLYFGKLFVNHGFMLDHGHYCLPSIEPSSKRKSIGALPFSSKARADLNVPLRLDQVETLVPILRKAFLEIGGQESISGAVELAFAACRFYQQALTLYDADPELSYLSLVNAGEVLVSGLKFSRDELKDEQLEPLLKEIDESLKPETAQELRRRLFSQISRRFRVGLHELLNAAFFAGSEAKEEFYKLTPERVEIHLKAAYTLRSKLLHEGTRFGGWVRDLIPTSEIFVGEPADGSNSWKKLISEAPTLVGLERLVRFCILRFVHKSVAPLLPQLD